MALKLKTVLGQINNIAHVLNENFQRIKDKVLLRDGSTPMEGDLDLGGHRLVGSKNLVFTGNELEDMLIDVVPIEPPPPEPEPEPEAFFYYNTIVYDEPNDAYHYVVIKADVKFNKQVFFIIEYNVDISKYKNIYSSYDTINIDALGNVYILDTSRNIWSLDFNGNLRFTSNAIYHPPYLITNRDGTSYILSGSHHLTVIDSEGNIIYTFEDTQFYLLNLTPSLDNQYVYFHSSSTNNLYKCLNNSSFDIIKTLYIPDDVGKIFNYKDEYLYVHTDNGVIKLDVDLNVITINNNIKPYLYSHRHEMILDTQESFIYIMCIPYIMKISLDCDLMWEITSDEIKEMVFRNLFQDVFELSKEEIKQLYIEKYPQDAEYIDEYFDEFWDEQELSLRLEVYFLHYATKTQIKEIVLNSYGYLEGIYTYENFNIKWEEDEIIVRMDAKNIITNKAFFIYGIGQDNLGNIYLRIDERYIVKLNKDGICLNVYTINPFILHYDRYGYLDAPTLASYIPTEIGTEIKQPIYPAALATEDNKILTTETGEYLVMED